MVGHRLGFEDARGTLFYEFARVVKETEPKVFLFENVRGLLSHDKGRTWHVIHDIFEELGYDVKFRVLNSCDYGIPQHRERVFCLALRSQQTLSILLLLNWNIKCMISWKITLTRSIS